MAEDLRPSQAERFPSLLISFAVLLTAAVLGWLAWDTYHTYQLSSQLRARLFRIQQLQGVITHLDEVLTMSARMAAVTGDAAWEQRYLHFEPLLDQAIKETTRLEPNVHRGQVSAQTDAANIELVGMEHQAFSLVRQGKLPEARRLLFSSEYEAQKRIYSEGMSKVGVLLSNKASELLRAEEHGVRLHSLITLALLSALLAGWLLVMRTLHRWRSRLAASARQLDEQARELARLNLQEKAFSEAVIQGLPAGIFVLDEAGRILRWNEKLESMLGRSELRNLTALEVLAEHDRKPAQKAMRQVFEQGAAELEGSLLNAKGALLPCYLRGVRIVLDGRPRILGAALDISKRKQAEEALLQSEKRHRDLVTSAHDWVWETDQHGVYTYVGPQCRELLGYDPEELAGKSPFDLMPEEEKQRVAKIFATIESQKAPFRSLENINRHKNGRLVTLETNGVPVFDRAGNLCGYRGMDRDITRRKQAEETLKQSEQHFRSLFDSISDTIFIHDLTGRILDANQSACNNLGFKRDELLRLSLPDFEIGISPASAKALWNRMLQGENITAPGIHRRADGTTFPVEVRLNLFEHGGQKAVLAVARDVTLREKAEQALRDNEARLKLILNSLQTGIVLIDAQSHRIVEANPEALRLIGAPLGEVAGAVCHKFICPAREGALSGYRSGTKSGQLRAYPAARQRRKVGHYQNRGAGGDRGPQAPAGKLCGHQRPQSR